MLTSRAAVRMRTPLLRDCMHNAWHITSHGSWIHGCQTCRGGQAHIKHVLGCCGCTGGLLWTKHCKTCNKRTSLHNMLCCTLHVLAICTLESGGDSVSPLESRLDFAPLAAGRSEHHPIETSVTHLMCVTPRHCQHRGSAHCDRVLKLFCTTFTGAPLGPYDGWPCSTSLHATIEAALAAIMRHNS